MSEKMDWDRVNRENRGWRHRSAHAVSSKNEEAEDRQLKKNRQLKKFRKNIVRITGKLGEVTFDKLYGRCRAWKIEEREVSAQRLLKELELLAEEGKLQLIGEGAKLVVRTASGRPAREGEGE